MSRATKAMKKSPSENEGRMIRLSLKSQKSVGHPFVGTKSFITTESGQAHKWSWGQLLDLPSETVTVDIHCVTKWSKLGTTWEGVSLDTLMRDVETAAEFALAHSYGGYTTNLPLEDLLEGKAWIAYRYEGEDLTPEHGGPARLLVPHLYFWKSAKWIRGIQLLLGDEPGFWETLGYHDYGDPWREQRYQGD
jgi:DMSO/TMAO reductase YedYZ molybdopterin-dependent catalytic subunit